MFGWLSERLDALEDQTLRRRLVARDARGPWLLQGDRRLLNFGSNDYLGIAMESSEPAAACEAGRKTTSAATGAGASPLVCGFSTLHERLCCVLAGLEGTESALLFPSGFAACSGVIAGLAEAGDLILSDALNHASLIDGCRLSKAERFIYPHRDLKAVKALLESHRQRFQRVFLVTDSIFSMDGTRSPLAELNELAKQYRAILIVDEAHATGVLGAHGGGLCEELGIAADVPIRIGTLSKALGCQGGFVAGPRLVTDYLLQTARSLIYSTAAPPATIQAALDALEIVRDEPNRRQTVLEYSDQLTARLRSAGVKVVGERTPIVPVILGSPQLALEASAALSHAGFFVPAIRPPTVPSGTSRLRISLSAAHPTEAIDELCDAILKIIA